MNVFDLNHSAHNPVTFCYKAEEITAHVMLQKSTPKNSGHEITESNFAHSWRADLAEVIKRNNLVHRYGMGTGYTDMTYRIPNTKYQESCYMLTMDGPIFNIIFQYQATIIMLIIIFSGRTGLKQLRTSCSWDKYKAQFWLGDF